ncbi:MAG: hypothetical protein U9R60_13760 [Bacteroidota bacterium]|nr:hypothetical protein [Bacteroidota bacterium]
MKLQYDFETKEGYLQLNIKGAYNKDEFLEFPEIITDRCDEVKIYKVLVDGLAIRGSDISTSDRYFIGEKFGLKLQDRIMIAVVWPVDSIDKFAETVALNRGGNMYVVGDYQLAKDWLLNGPV